MKKLLSLLLTLAVILALFAGCAAESGKIDGTKASATAPEKASGEAPAKSEPTADAGPAATEPGTEPAQPEPDTAASSAEPEPDTNPAQSEPDTAPAQPEPSDSPDPSEIAGKYILQQINGMDFIEAMTAELENEGVSLEALMEEEGVSTPEELRITLQLNADGTCKFSTFEDVCFWVQQGSAVTVYGPDYNPDDENIDEPLLFLAYLDGTLTGSDWDELLYFVREDSPGLGEITIPLGRYDLRVMNGMDFEEFLMQESGDLEGLLEEYGVSSMEEVKDLFALRLNGDGTGEYWNYSFTWTQVGSSLICQDEENDSTMYLAYADGCLIGCSDDGTMIFK